MYAPDVPCAIDEIHSSVSDLNVILIQACFFYLFYLFIYEHQQEVLNNFKVLNERTKEESGFLILMQRSEKVQQTEKRKDFCR